MVSTSCSQLRKAACATKEGCSWIVGKGCKSSSKVLAQVHKSDDSQAIKKLNINLAEGEQKIIDGIQIYNKLTLQKKLSKKDIQAINDLMIHRINIDSRVQTKFVKEALEIIKKGPPAPPKYIVDDLFAMYEGKEKITKQQVKAAMLTTFKQRSLHNLNIKKYPTINIDVASALFYKWNSWSDTDPRESMFRVLSAKK